MYIESHLRPFTLSLEGLFSFLLSPVVSFLQPSNLQTFQRSTCLGRRLPQHSNLQPVNISTPLNPKSLPLNPFADPHPLNLYATIFYKNMAGEGDAPAPVGSLPTLALSPLAATLMDLSASVANKKLTGQAKLFRCNTYKKPGGGDAMGVPLVVPQYRYVASTYLLCFLVLRKNRGCGGILPILELQSLSRAPGQRCVLCGDDAGSAWRCSGKSLRKASRCKSQELRCRRCPPIPFRPCGFPAETL